MLRAAVTLCAALFASAAFAQDYPSKALRIVAPFAPGATSDLLGRLVGESLRAAWNVAVIVENKPGAGGVIGADFVAKSAPDGHTLLVGAASIGVMPALYKELPFQLYKDLVPVSILGTVPFMLVAHPSLPVRSVQELVAYAKLNPGKLSFGSGGNGTISHLGGELLKSRAGLDMVHVPFKGGAQSMTALLGGQIHFAIDGGPHVVSQVKANAVRLLAVATRERLAEFAATPTIAESGFPGFESNAWQSLWVAGGTPPAALQKLAAEVQRAVRAPEIAEKFRAMGIEPIGSSPDEAERFVRAETAKWAEVIRVSGAKAN